MQTIRMLIKKMIDEAINDKPSWMAIRSWGLEALRILDCLERKKKK